MVFKPVLVDQIMPIIKPFQSVDLFCFFGHAIHKTVPKLRFLWFPWLFCPLLGVTEGYAQEWAEKPEKLKKPSFLTVLGIARPTKQRFLSF